MRLWYFKTIIFCLFTTLTLQAQKKVTFLSSDQLIITADLYQIDKGNPYIILLHQENSSRGEFKDIAPRLQKLGFNCLAVDLRIGKESNYIQNETVVQAQNDKIQTSAMNCENDILAAINYLNNITSKNKIILFGSSFSASLAMKIGNHNKRIAAVISFSPGEYFGPSYPVKSWVNDFDKPLYVAATKREFPYVKDLVKDVPRDKLVLFQPSGEGKQGAPALWANNPSSSEYWMSLMVFLKKIKENGKF